MTQCKELGIDVRQSTERLDAVIVNKEYDYILDALFGFSFKGPAREPFQKLINIMKDVETPIVSVDVPSGWDIEKGDIHQTNFTPNCVVSLTAPKQCMRDFKGVHYLGGRFVPPSISKKYELQLPQYPGTEQYLLIENRTVGE